MSDGRPNNPRHPASDDALPRELRLVARLLDDEGARQRARLNEEALQRIFAASDLQRPLGMPEVSPIAGRIAPARSVGRPYLRIAAAIAALAGLGAVIAIAVFSNRTALRDGVEIAQDPSGGTRDLSGGTPGAPQGRSETSKRVLAVDHLDAALADDYAASTASRPAGAVIVALADRRAGSLAGFASADEALAQELEPLFSSGALLDGGDSTYDDLSQELAAVMTQSAAKSSSSSSPR
jgi:hypothetical protein